MKNVCFRLTPAPERTVFDTAKSDRDLLAGIFRRLYRDKMEQSRPSSRAEKRAVTCAVLEDAQSKFAFLYLESWSLALVSVQSLLDSIGLSAAQDDLVIENLDGWRDCFGRLEVFLSTTRQQLDNMEADLRNTPQSDLCIPSINKLQDMCTALYERLGRISQTTIATMTVLESKEAINEAHAVTRLTELAFVFVPLSFACSFFGMDLLVRTVEFLNVAPSLR